MVTRQITPMTDTRTRRFILPQLLSFARLPSPPASCSSHLELEGAYLYFLLPALPLVKQNPRGGEAARSARQRAHAASGTASHQVEVKELVEPWRPLTGALACGTR